MLSSILPQRTAEFGVVSLDPSLELLVLAIWSKSRPQGVQGLKMCDIPPIPPLWSVSSKEPKPFPHKAGSHPFLSATPTSS